MSCPKCAAPVGAGCRNADGTKTFAYHQARWNLLRERPAESADCEGPLVPCWIPGCTSTPRRCEFCGVCEDPRCRKRHRP